MHNSKNPTPPGEDSDVSTHSRGMLGPASTWRGTGGHSPRVVDAETILERLELARRDLLDLGLRNPLLNYRLLKARGLEFSVSEPQAVYDRLVSNGLRVSFISAPKSEENTGQGEISSSHAITYSGNRNDAFQTVHTANELHKRLLKTYYAARTYVEEQGVDVLYLAFGFLKWYESSSSGSGRSAPLVLVPVHINRTDVRSRFYISYAEEDLETNLSLQAKLVQDFGIQLPDLPDGEFELQEYYHQVAEVISDQDRWNVDADAIALGFFSFGTFLMYRDLLEEGWHGVMDIASHPVLASLLGDGFGPVDSSIADDAFLDDLVGPDETRQVLDADSSQMMALMGVKQGHNLIIQGPPGTGKSRTITNIIAQAISEEKHVLFVAEKMAALEVVKRRLDQVGLGDACLELHSEKSNKRAVLSELQRTLSLGQPQVEDGSQLSLLAGSREQLNAHSNALNSPVLDSGVSPYRCIGNLLRLGRKLANVPIPDVDEDVILSWNERDHLNGRALLEQTETVVGQIGRPVDHPYWACRPPRLGPTSGGGSTAHLSRGWGCDCEADARLQGAQRASSHARGQECS